MEKSISTMIYFLRINQLFLLTHSAFLYKYNNLYNVLIINQIGSAYEQENLATKKS